MEHRLWHRAAFALLGSVAVAACSSSTEPGARAASIEAVSSTTISGSAGQPAPQSPTVRVLASDGSRVQGAIVRFRVTAGLGTLEFSDVTSDANGLASSGTWTLGPQPGDQTVTASVDGVTPSIIFTSNTGPGPPSQVAIVSGSGQEAEPGTALPTNLTVRVRDAFDTPIPNQSVTFSIAAGGGTIAGAASTTATTDAEGVATAGPWVLGSSPGANLITAQAGTATAQFTATGLGPCDVQPLITLGTTGGTIAGTDCVVNAINRDNYRFTVTAGQAILVELTGTFDTFLNLTTTAGVPLARDDNGGAGTNSTLRFVPSTSGMIVIGAGAAAPGETGSYSLTVSTTTQVSDGCGPPTYLQFGVSTAQTIAEADCGDPAADEFWVYIQANTAARITMASPIDAYLFVTTPEGVTVEVDDAYLDDIEVYDVTPSATSGGFYRIRASSWGIVFEDVDPELDLGPYTLTVSAPTASASASISRDPSYSKAAVREAAIDAKRRLK